MKHGDIVSLSSGVYCVALTVTKTMCSRATRADQRILVSKPGLYLFAGYWYGRDPLDVKSYGKMYGTSGRVVGRVRSHNQLTKLLKLHYNKTCLS